MGLMQWKKAQKSEVGSKDKHHPKKCFSESLHKDLEIYRNRTEDAS